LYQYRTIVRVLEDAAAMALHEAYDYAIEQVELALAQHRWRTRRSIVYVMSATGTFETCLGSPTMSVDRGRPEVTGPLRTDAFAE
jgi:hypothetical protein